MADDELDAWCRRLLGAAPSQLLFRRAHLSATIGLRLSDGREVVVKVRQPAARLHACFAVQTHMWAAGFPAHSRWPVLPHLARWRPRPRRLWTGAWSWNGPPLPLDCMPRRSAGSCDWHRGSPHCQRWRRRPHGCGRTMTSQVLGRSRMISTRTSIRGPARPGWRKSDIEPGTGYVSSMAPCLSVTAIGGRRMCAGLTIVCTWSTTGTA